MFKILYKDSKGRARVGRLETLHGVVETPAYVIVGTYGEVRTLRAEDIPKTKTQIIIANTYHLWRALGDEKLKKYPGLHAAMRWDGPIMTDSGGFQVFSLGVSRSDGIGKVLKEGNLSRAPRKNLVEITDDGVWFLENGEKIYLDAERSMAIQERLGADIVVAFDEPTSPLHDYDYTKDSMERTCRWARRSLEAKKSDQLILGVVQGGPFEDLRKASARYIGGLNFDGFAIGGAYGSSFGDSKVNTERELAWSIPELPEDKPRHLFGIGRIEDIFEGVGQGIDMFDCVIPTREARHGSAWIQGGRVDLAKGKYKNDMGRISKDCTCPVCSMWQIRLGDLHKLFKEKNPDAGRFTTIHNVYFFNDLMRQIREAISENRFSEFSQSFL